MPQLDKFTYFTQFFWSFLFLFTLSILICRNWFFQLKNKLFIFYIIHRQQFVFCFFVFYFVFILSRSTQVLLDNLFPFFMILPGPAEIAPYVLKMDPGVPAPAPEDPGIPIIPELPNPLIPDMVRMRELEDRMSIHLMENRLTPETKCSILASQTVIEKKVEAALVMDGFNPEAMLAKRGQIRGFLFYHQGRLLSDNTYFDYVKSIDLEGTRASIPYRRVVKAIRQSDLIL